MTLDAARGVCFELSGGQMPMDWHPTLIAFMRYLKISVLPATLMVNRMPSALPLVSIL